MDFFSDLAASFLFPNRTSAYLHQRMLFLALTVILLFYITYIVISLRERIINLYIQGLA
jgi:hypothetical protein